MVVRIRNMSGVTVRIVDCYMINPETVGYYGPIAYSIADGGMKTVRSSVFTEELMEDHMYPQRICVQREVGEGKWELIPFHEGGGEEPQPLTHVQFENNNGRDLLLRMVENVGVAPRLRYEFVLPQIGGGGGGGGWSRFLHNTIRGLLPAAASN